MQTLKKEEQSAAVSQFELTSELITKLNTFKITPTAKLVLLYLTTCYNPKHKEVFPKQKTIAEKLGISERSVTRAIQELFEEGLILIECKYTNRYKFTSKITLSDNTGKNVSREPDNLSDPYIEQIRETKKEQTLKSGENVYKGDDKILEDYAIKHGARNVKAYINALKSTKSAEKIINEQKKTGIHYSEKRTDLLRCMREQQRRDRSEPEECAAWVEFGKKHGIKKIL